MNSSQGSGGSQGKDARRAGSGSSDAVPEFHDNQQVRDDGMTSGESVLSSQTSADATQPTDLPNQAANKEKAEGSRMPTRGEAKDGSDA
jgi:hypothetical protein